MLTTRGSKQTRAAPGLHGGGPRSIFLTLVATFLITALAVGTFVAMTIAVHTRTIEQAVRLEARHVAEAIGSAVTKNDGFIDDLQDYVLRLHARRARDVVVVDPTLRGIADVDPEDVGKPFHGGHGEVARTLVDGVPRTFVEFEPSHPNGIHQVVVPVRAHGAAHGPIIGAVVLEYSGIRDLLLGETREALYAICIGGVLVVLAVAAFGIGVARRVTRPLRNLQEGLERIVARDYAARVEITTHDEIGRLTHAFNAMAAGLEASDVELVAHRVELEQRVAERTRALNEANALLHRQVEQRSWEATHDVLTGLVNRREFERVVAHAVVAARGEGRQHVVCCMDLDRFKVVNDTCGHAAGDELLRRLAALLQTRIRGSDTLARLGGDEFGLLLEGCTIGSAERVAAMLLAAVDGFQFDWEGKVFTVGISIGLCPIAPETADAEALGMADTACYWAKEQGRNRVCVYRSSDTGMAARRREVSWITRINQALAEDRFVLFHQDYLALGSEAAAQGRHLEVLLRMVDEDGTLVQPGSFIPAAERYNLMPSIDRWVIRNVFENYRTLVAERGGVPLTCAINLSATSINAAGFLAFIREVAEAHALPPGSICFEITETVAINNLRHATEFVQQCKAMGFLFALDDFGTGTSSFGYLKNLPVDYLKIDGGFVKNLAVDQIDRAMTETINRIGHIMGIKTVAEYAEDEGIIEALRAMGVDFAQGYGVCKPTPLLGPRASVRAARVPLAETA